MKLLIMQFGDNMTKVISTESEQIHTMDANQIAHYKRKLQYEIDSWDLTQAIQQKENIVVIDARSAEAYKREHIPGAVNFSYKTINKDSAQSRLNYDTLYVTYCDGIGCNASTKGALKLAELGYKVKELIGGIDWWKRDQYPTNLESLQNIGPNNSCGCD